MVPTLLVAGLAALGLLALALYWWLAVRHDDPWL